MNAEPVTSDADLEALRGEWTALCAETDASPFRTPEWLLPWWRHVADGDLLTVAVREGPRLVGLLPAYVWRRPEDGVRHLFLLGVATTDSLDGVFAVPDAVEAALAALHDLRDRWDVAVLDQLAVESSLLGAEVPPGWRSRIEAGASCHGLPLSDGTPPLPRKMLKNLRHYRRKAELAGALRTERADARTLAALAEVLFRLHRERWREQGLSARVEAWHRAAMPELLRHGSLRLDVTWLDDRPVGAMYALADRRAVRLYLMAWDPTFEAYSAGTLVIGEAVERAAAEGAAAVDFLRGGEPYKRLWGVVEEPMFRRVLSW